MRTHRHYFPIVRSFYALCAKNSEADGWFSKQWVKSADGTLHVAVEKEVQLDCIIHRIRLGSVVKLHYATRSLNGTIANTILTQT